MNFANSLNNLRKAVIKKLSGDMSSVFIATTIIGYLASAGGQLYGIGKNDKLAHDKKKFLRAQELADCAINIMAYGLITKNLTKATKKLASSGKILSKSIVETAQKCDINLKDMKNIGSEITTKLSKLNSAKEILEAQKIGNLDTFTKINKQITNLENFKEKYTPFENGMAMLGTIGGGLISSDFVAPVLRNKYASIKQKQEQPVISYSHLSINPKGNMKI